MNIRVPGVAWLIGIPLLIVGCGIDSTPVDNQSAPSPQGSTSKFPPPKPAAVSNDQQEFELTDSTGTTKVHVVHDGTFTTITHPETELTLQLILAKTHCAVTDPNGQTRFVVVIRPTQIQFRSFPEDEELYEIQRSDDGDWKLKDSDDNQLLRIKRREYGYEIETLEKKSLYKARTRDQAVVLEDSSKDEIIRCSHAVNPLAVTSFGLAPHLETQHQLALFAAFAFRTDFD